MIFPEKIKVGPHIVTTMWWGEHDDDREHYFGKFYASKMMIRYDASMKGTLAIDTLLHELMHAVFWVYHMEDDDDEERTVSTMATGLTQVLKDNPDVVTFINAALVQE